jgi:hypothetical protein
MSDPQASRNRRCDHCQWFGHNDDATEQSDFLTDHRGRTNCRRFPPGYEGYPLVPADGPACGEFLPWPNGTPAPESTAGQAKSVDGGSGIPLSELPF